MATERTWPFDDELNFVNTTIYRKI